MPVLNMNCVGPESGPGPESISGVGHKSELPIQTSDPDDFQNLTGTSLFKTTFVVKFSRSRGDIPHVQI